MVLVLVVVVLVVLVAAGLVVVMMVMVAVQLLQVMVQLVLVRMLAGVQQRGHGAGIRVVALAGGGFVRVMGVKFCVWLKENSHLY